MDERRVFEQKLSGRCLKKARLCRGMSQSDVAKYLCIDQSTYSGYETGRRAIPTHLVRELCSYLLISPNDLFGFYFLVDNTS